MPPWQWHIRCGESCRSLAAARRCLAELANWQRAAAWSGVLHASHARLMLDATSARHVCHVIAAYCAQRRPSQPAAAAPAPALTLTMLLRSSCSRTSSHRRVRALLCFQARPHTLRGSDRWLWVPDPERAQRARRTHAANLHRDDRGGLTLCLEACGGRCRREWQLVCGHRHTHRLTACRHPPSCRFSVCRHLPRLFIGCSAPARSVTESHAC